MAIVFLAALVAATAGCQTMGFYAQAAAGQWSLMRARVPVADVLRDPSTPTALAQKLDFVDSVLDFAHADLALPRDGRYRSYVKLDRSSVVWNVFATREFSVDPVQWCYPIVGCAAYRGYFHQEAARREALRLARRARDVTVAGAAAYSTLGWFDDPLLSTFLAWHEPMLAGLLIHELAHGRVFVAGDTEFNEGYASFVEQEGVAQWLAKGHDEAGLRAWRESTAAEERFSRFMLHWRAALARLYAVPYPEFAKRMMKAEMMRAVTDCYRANRDRLGNGARDTEFATELNNADFVPWAAYAGWVPSFAALWRSVDGDWVRFHAAVADLGHLEPEPRRQTLLALAPAASIDAAEEAPVACEALTPEADEMLGP